jgi:GMP reductase
MVPYKGEVADTIQDLLGGIRSTCTYVGAKRLKDISKCTTFIRCTDTHNRTYE